MKFTNKISAFVLGNGLNSLGVVRSLGRHQIPVYVVCIEKEDEAVKSCYARHIILKDTSDEAMVAVLTDSARRLDHKPALFFTSDYFLKFVSRCYDVLSKYFLIQISSHDSIEAVSDKKKFAEFTDKNRFPAPRTHIPSSLSEVVKLADKLEYPVILKPSESYQWRNKNYKIVYVDNKEILVKRWGELQGSCDNILIQQFIMGPDKLHYAYCAYRTVEKGEVVSICVNKTRLNPIHGGVCAFLQVVRDEEMEDVGKRILESLNYIGIGSVDFKKDERTGRPFIHEVNGRLPLWHSVMQMCGIDLPYIMYRDLINSPIDIPANVTKHGKWVSLPRDISSLRQYQRKGEIGLWEWLKSFRGLRMCAEFAWDDWGPFWFCLKQLINKSLQKFKTKY